MKYFKNAMKSLIYIYINIDNQKKNGELLEVRVEFGSEQCDNLLTNLFIENYFEFRGVLL